ncbi:molybdate ABC transporter permease subunit [Paenibacillus thermotolerans]|uniref:molybdate ABC transporter permease subunit n=1 Tax=Paenibacillus thermotolerans TaxID=3027807 RepID=UPI00236849B1|nr:MULTISPECIES: molybdate ABC transporter permease subunit [unclassified Paenibacillus]
MLTDSFWIPVRLSLEIAAVSGTIAFILGIVAAWALARRRFPGKSAIETVFLLPLVLPPTVIGFSLLVLLGKSSPIAPLLEAIWGSGVLFTPGAAVAASVFIAFPLVYMTVRSGFEVVEEELLAAARSMGASPFQTLRYVLLPLARRSLIAAFVLGFARSLGEFGATMMVAGIIPGRTQTVPSAIYVAVETGRFDLAWAWSGVMAVVSFALLFAAGRIRD